MLARTWEFDYWLKLRIEKSQFYLSLLTIIEHKSSSGSKSIDSGRRSVLKSVSSALRGNYFRIVLYEFLSQKKTKLPRHGWQSKERLSELRGLMPPASSGSLHILFVQLLGSYFFPIMPSEISVVFQPLKEWNWVWFSEILAWSYRT